jgi:hypothetical protein
MIDKRELTKKFINQLSLPTDNKTFQKHLKLWWMNPRNLHPKSFRLTDVGFKMLTEKMEMTYYDVAFPDTTEWNSGLILRLDKFLDSPYYIDKKSISVFREKTAIELILFEGDIQRYTQAKAMSQKNNKNST